MLILTPMRVTGIPTAIVNNDENHYVYENKQISDKMPENKSAIYV